ncbi:MAG: protein kinase [Solirubrobacteraceae bacterium]|nr:protein kinase [Solirubrobacteraceae bacterium]
MLLGGRYELGEPIASGAMGTVHRGLDRETGDAVAIKRVADASHARRLDIEARVLARLRHPRIVRYLDHVVTDRGVHLVMALVDGDDLAAVTRERGTPGLPLDDAVALTAQAGEALHYLHGEHTLHRDVKPENLVLSADGVVLVDFGIAREELEGTGTLAIGSPGFMAPESLTGSASPRTDVYGLAATLWALLHGVPPRIGQKARIPGGTLPPEIAEALDDALDPDPVRRTATVAELLARIGAPLDGVAGRPLTIAVGTETGASEPLAALARTAAAVLDAAAVSVALVDPADGALTYRAAWGAGADEVIGMRLPAGEGLAGAVVAEGRALRVPDCRTDPRFSAATADRTGYVPYTMLVVPLRAGAQVVGVLSALDRRDGAPLDADDERRAEALAELAVAVPGWTRIPETEAPTVHG